MADGYFERGEVYWVNVGTGIVETKVGRPGVIVSCNRLNRSGRIVVAMMTRTEKNYPWDVVTDATGKTSTITCDALLCVSPPSLGKCIGVLNDDEMRQVDRGLEEVLDLGYVDDGKDTEIAILKAKLEATEEAKKDELLSLKVECEMWKKMYTKALDFVVEQNVAGAIAVVSKKSAPKPEVEPPKVEPKPSVTEESGSPVIVESGLIDINHCTETELKKLGFSTPMSRLIKSYRPFKDVPDLKRVPGMSKVKYQIIEKKVCCTPVVVEEPVAVPETEPKKYGKSGIVWNGVKVNINTVETAREIFQRTGLNEKACIKILGYRKEHGPYASVRDLEDLGFLGSITMKRYAHMLEV